MDKLLNSELFSQIPNCIFWKDKNSVFLGANLFFIHLVGFDSLEQIMGMTDFDMPWGKTHADLYRKRDQEVLNGVLTQNKIESQLRANGEVVNVIINKAPLRDRKNTIIGVVGSFFDVPAHLENQEEKVSYILKLDTFCIHKLIS